MLFQKSGSLSLCEHIHGGNKRHFIFDTPFWWLRFNSGFLYDSQPLILAFEMKRNRHTGDSADNPFDYIRVSRILCIGCLFQHPFPQFIQTVIAGNDDLTIFLVPGIDKRAFYSSLADIRASFHQIFFADFSQCLGNDGLDPIWFGNLLGDQILDSIFEFIIGLLLIIYLNNLQKETVNGLKAHMGIVSKIRS